MLEINSARNLKVRHETQLARLSLSLLDTQSIMATMKPWRVLTLLFFFITLTQVYAEEVYLVRIKKSVNESIFSKN